MFSFKNTMVIMLMCFSVFKAIGQTTVTIGTGTATDYSNPFETYFNYGWSSQLYLQSEIGAAGSISAIGFYVTNSGSSYTLTNQKIYVRHTSATSHADKYYPTTTGFTLVYDGSITFGTSGWKTITLTTPFAYNGTSNLEVMVESRDGSTFTSAVQSRYTNQSGSGIYRTKYDYNDYSFPSTYQAGGKIAHYSNIQFTINTCTNTGGTASASAPTVCSGGSSTISLTGNNGTPIQWQSSSDNTTFTDISGASSATYVASNLSATNYYRAKIGSGSCIVYSTSALVTVNTTPSAPTVGNNGPICEGTPLSLTATTIAEATYSWSGPNGFTSSLQNPTVNANATTAMSGIYSVTATVNGCVSLAETTTVTVSTPVSSVALDGTQVICANGTTTFTASTTGGTWTSGTPSVATVSSTGEIIGLTVGTSEITYTINGTGGCNNVSATRTVTVNPNPSQNTSTPSNVSICRGESVLFTSSALAANETIQWQESSNNIDFTSISGETNVTYTAENVLASKYVRSIVSLGTCTYTGPSIPITVLSSPTSLNVSASQTTIASGESTTLTASGATNYTWDHNLGTGVSKTVSPTGTTTYTITGDNGNTCTESASITITVSGTASSINTVQVGTLGNGTDYSNPYQTYFNYGWSSQLYLASEINKTGKINAISYYVNNSGPTYTLDNQKVYVRHTTLASYTDKIHPGISGFTLVYEGSITFGASGWNLIPFSTAFDYNGTDNIEILIESRDASTFTSAIQTRYTNQSGTSIYRTKYNYNNDNFPSLTAEGLRIHHYSTAQFTINTCTISAGTVSASVSSVCSGGDVTLTASNQTVGQNIQWQFSTDDVTYTDISNQTASTYNATNVTTAGYYRVQVGSGACVVYSAGVYVLVKDKPESPIISADLTKALTNQEIYFEITNVINGSMIQWQKSVNNLDYLSVTETTPHTLVLKMPSTPKLYVRAEGTFQDCNYYSNVVFVSLDSIVDTDSIYVTDRQLNHSKGSLDRVINRALISANEGNNVFVLFKLTPDENNNSLYYVNEALPIINNTLGKISFKKAHNSEYEQGIEFGPYYSDANLIYDFWGRASVYADGFSTKAKITKSNQYYALKRKIDATYYKVDGRLNILPLMYYNQYATSTYSYKIYSQNRYIVQSGTIIMERGKNNFVVNLDFFGGTGFYTYELINSKGDVNYCKFYMKRNYIYTDDFLEDRQPWFNQYLPYE